jgi:hypothetical protein
VSKGSVIWDTPFSFNGRATALIVVAAKLNESAKAKAGTTKFLKQFMANLQ